MLAGVPLLRHVEADMQPLAWIAFVDGTLRPVFELAGKQYVKDDLGEPVFGNWCAPLEDISRSEWDELFGHDEADTPIAVLARQRTPRFSQVPREELPRCRRRLPCSQSLRRRADGSAESVPAFGAAIDCRGQI